MDPFFYDRDGFSEEQFEALKNDFYNGFCQFAANWANKNEINVSELETIVRQTIYKGLGEG